MADRGSFEAGSTQGGRRPKRRRLIVGNLQYRLLAGNFLYLSSIVLALFAATFLPMILLLDDNSLAGSQRDSAARNLLSMSERLWIAVPVIVFLCLLHSIFVSHRIAGPLYRIKQVFKELCRGDLSIRVKLRRADYLMQEAECMNEMIDGVAARVQRIHDAHVEASATFDELVRALGPEERQDAEAVLLGKLELQLSQLGGAIRGVQTPETNPSTEQPRALVRSV